MPFWTKSENGKAVRWTGCIPSCFRRLRVKIRGADSRTVKNKAVYVALGVTRDGSREVLGL